MTDVRRVKCETEALGVVRNDVSGMTLHSAVVVIASAQGRFSG